MPTYNMPEMDTYAADVYRDNGFQIQPINVSTLYQDGRAIRCFANMPLRQPNFLIDHHENIDPTGHSHIHNISAWESTDVAGLD